MAKKWYTFIMSGITTSGASTGGATPVQVCAESAEEAKKKAKEKFGNSHHVIKITKCELKK